MASEKNGWIKLHRKMLDNPIIMKDADHLAIWMYLLLNATHAEYPALFKGQKIMLQPGQLITGRKSIAEKLVINESKVRRVLDSFESDQQIDRQRSNQNTLISLLNWDKYQCFDQQSDQPAANQRPTSDQRVTTNKNVKNIKNVKNNKLYKKTTRKEPTPKWMTKNQRQYDFDNLESQVLANGTRTAANDPDIKAKADALRQQLGG